MAVVLKRLDQSMDLDDPGKVHYFLVFQKGKEELRLPVPKETAYSLIKQTYSQGPAEQQEEDSSDEFEKQSAAPPPPPPPVPSNWVPGVSPRPAPVPYTPPGVRHPVAARDADLYTPDEDELGFPPPSEDEDENGDILSQIYGRSPRSEDEVQPL